MREIACFVNADVPQDVVVALDASVAGRDRAAIMDLLGALFRELPASIEPTLYFLGNPSPYRSSGFHRNGDKWFAENQRRTRLLRPIYEAPGAAGAGAILAFPAGPIYDIEDFLDSPQFARTSFFRCSDASAARPSVTPAWMTDEMRQRECEPTVEQLRRLAHDPMQRVEIWCPHGIPYYWDNAAYRFEDNKLIAAAPSTGATGSPFSVWVGFQSEIAAKPRAVATLQSGERLELPIEETPRNSQSEWQSLPTEEALRFQQCLMQHMWLCANCNEVHEEAFVACKNDLDRQVQPPALAYPSQQQARNRGFLLLRESGDAVEVCHHDCDALRLDARRIAIRQGDKIVMLHSTGSSREWRGTTESLTQYTPLYENGSLTAYVVFF